MNEEEKDEIKINNQSEIINELKRNNKEFLENVIKNIFELNDILNNALVIIEFNNKDSIIDTKTAVATKIGAANKIINDLVFNIENNNSYDLNWNLCKFWRAECCKFNKQDCKFIHLDNLGSYGLHCPFQSECILNGINCNCAEKIRKKWNGNNNNINSINTL